MNIASKAVEPEEEADVSHSRESTVDQPGPTLGFAHQSSSIRYRISAFFSLFLLPTARANPEISLSGGWEDFANNLGSDLAPLLALFGEQVTKQYLSEALSVLDCLLFALAPLGIITAMVSAIRVAGSPLLRSLVGRAKESRGSVEADLMSSTSADVCELWNGEGVVRVLGKPVLLQLVCFNENGENSQRPEGIHSFREAVEQGLYRAQRGAGNAAVELTALPGAQVDVEDLRALDKPPNLSLNVSVKPLDRRILVCFVGVGVLLQAGVLVYAAVSQYWLKLQKNDRAPVAYGVYVLFAGTISLAAGVFGCAMVIERSTVELTWVPASRKALKSVIWLQQGGQTVGDQRFESFARIVHGSGNILSSHKSAKAAADTGDTWDDIQEPTPATQTFGTSALVATAVATAFIGFIVQFLGLRVMHASVTIAQLGVILIMTALRSFAYIQRNNRNEIKHPDQIEGHELDWLAENLTNCQEWQVIAAPAENEGELRAVADPVAQLMKTRARLAKLSMDWKLDVRVTVEILQVVLEATINDVFAKMTLVPGVEDKSEFEWNIPVKARLQRPSMESGNITLKLKRSKDDNSYWRAWQIEKSELEAVLSLWVYSITTLGRKRERSGQPRFKQVWLLDLATEEAIINHKLWIHRGITPESMSLNLEAFYCYFGWIGTSITNGRSTPNSNSEQYLAVEREGTLVRVCAQSLYSSFIFSLASKITDVGGVTARRIDEPTAQRSSGDHWSQFRLSNSNLASLAAIYNESLLGTVEAAYFSIIPAFRAAKRLPYPHEAYKEARATSARLSRGKDWEKTAQIDSWLYSNSQETEVGPPYVVAMGSEIIGRLRTLTETLLTRCLAMGDTIDESLSRLWDTAYTICRMITEPSVNQAVCAVNLYACHLTAKPTVDFEALYQLAQNILVRLPVTEIEKSDLLAKLYSVRRGPLFLGDEIEKYLLDPVSLQFAAMTTVYTGRDSPQRKKGPRELLLIQGFRTPLQFASEVGHARIVQQLITAGANINAEPGKHHGRTALQAAAGAGHNEIVELLLSTKAEVNAEPGEYHGRTALQAAAEGGHLGVVDRLLEKGADVNAAPSKHKGRTALQAAAGGGHLKVVNRLLEKGADVNAKPSYDGRTALQAAAEGGHLEVVNRLLEKGAGVNAGPSDHGLTALQAAAEGGHLDVVNRLLEKGAGVNARPSDHGWTALQAAAEGGYLGVVDRLLEKGADVNAGPSKHKGRTALQAAAEGGHLDVVNRLLENGAGVNAGPSDHGRTALQAAAEGGYLGVVDRLLEKGADVNAGSSKHKGRTALQAAADGGHLDVVDRLLEKGAGVNAGLSDGRTALQAAAASGHLDVVNRLLEKGAGVNARLSDHGRTALQAAAEGGYLGVVDRLLEKGADVNAGPSKHKGSTALQAAAASGHLGVVDRLLEKGAHVNTEPGWYHGRTALQAAAEGGHLDVVNRLLERGAHVNAGPSYHGLTALQAAAASGHLGVVGRLLEEEADVNARPSYDGLTALQAAAEGGHLDVVNQLLEKGADVNAGLSDGRTALQAAAASGHLDAVDRLLEEGADVNAGLSDGRTALQAAAASGHLDVVDRLLEKGADVNAGPSKYEGKTALQAAAASGHLGVVDRLLEKGADVNAKQSGVYHGRTALQAAAASGYTRVVARLRAAGAN
ncbi:hypothetical protein Q9L58_009681 [Maublancomyces gigas]|uniref:Uncharacterized protein n=1 Tax=Discina gigas TaxID=1032678 RepID=A0ABR3G679_9PEZI